MRAEPAVERHTVSYRDTDFLEMFGGCGTCVGAVDFERLLQRDPQRFEKGFA